jgi:hypothetical protein
MDITPQTMQVIHNPEKCCYVAIGCHQHAHVYITSYTQRGACLQSHDQFLLNSIDLSILTQGTAVQNCCTITAILCGLLHHNNLASDLAP